MKRLEELRGKKWYKVTVSHDPKTLKRLDKPKVFRWNTLPEAMLQVKLLRKDGLNKHQVEVSVEYELS